MRRAQANPGEILTHVFAFARKMVGAQGDKVCKSKGAETWGLLFFVDQLETYRCPKKQVSLDVANCLVNMVGVFPILVGRCRRTRYWVPSTSSIDALRYSVAILICSQALTFPKTSDGPSVAGVAFARQPEVVCTLVG